MARRVDPIVARKGIMLESFPMKQYKEMLTYCYGTELAMAHNDITDYEVVFTKIARWGKSQMGDTWQVFLLPKNHTK